MTRIKSKRKQKQKKKSRAPKAKRAPLKRKKKKLARKRASKARAKRRKLPKKKPRKALRKKVPTKRRKKSKARPRKKVRRKLRHPRAKRLKTKTRKPIKVKRRRKKKPKVDIFDEVIKQRAENERVRLELIEREKRIEVEREAFELSRDRKILGQLLGAHLDFPRIDKYEAWFDAKVPIRLRLGERKWLELMRGVAEDLDMPDEGVHSLRSYSQSGPRADVAAA